MRVILLLLVALPSFAAKWEVSVAFFAGAQVMDVVSSRGEVETNPLLGRGPFGTRQMAIKGSMAGGVILAEWLILRRFPGTRRAWTIANFAAGGVTMGVAARNWSH